MNKFKFLTEDDHENIEPTPEEFYNAVSVGREYFLNGNGIEENPFEGLLRTSFEEGWKLERDYDILRQSYKRAINEL